MATDTKIQWTHPPGYSGQSWNPVRGCSKESAGCDNCYAMKVAARMDYKGGPYEGLTRTIGGRPQWNGQIREVPEKLDEPVRRKKPTCYFVNSMSDLFHPSLDEHFIDDVIATTWACPQHLFLVLTKRAKGMLDYMTGQGPVQTLLPLERIHSSERKYRLGLVPPLAWPPPNLWLGVSAETQKTADDRIEQLIQTPAAVRFLSVEPMLEAIDIRHWLATLSIHWVIVGGESGRLARPFHLEWGRDLIDQCREYEVPAFFKQWGSNPYLDSEHSIVPHLHDSHGGDWDEWPAEWRVREWPSGPRTGG